MKNLWYQGDNTIACWRGDISPIVQTPRKLLALLRSIYAIGEETRILRASDIDLQNALTQGWESSRYITPLGKYTAKLETDLSWYRADGVVVSGFVGDLGALLDELQPAHNTIFPDRRQLGHHPVELFSTTRLAYQEERLISPRRTTEDFLIILTSDIWFPYVAGLNHPSCDVYKTDRTNRPDRFFDNRELAELHTPRLNRFLSSTAKLVVEAGGRWELDESDLDRCYSPWISPNGILLNGPTPPLMDSALVDVAWPELEDLDP